MEQKAIQTNVVVVYNYVTMQRNSIETPTKFDLLTAIGRQSFVGFFWPGWSSRFLQFLVSINIPLRFCLYPRLHRRFTRSHHDSLLLQQLDIVIAEPKMATMDLTFCGTF